MMTIQQAAQLLRCKLTQPSEASITGAQIDSRLLQVGNLFVAIKGQQVDGHDYIETARLAGASVALVSTEQADPLPQLVVDDVVEAFGILAMHWRQQSKCKVVAVTGSNGKTTVKEMLATILSQHHDVVATKGNLNNHLGVPLTLFRIQDKTQFAVIEMGANHQGEISQLVTLAKPDVALINNVGPAHIEGFGSLEGVAKAKGEIFSQLDENGIGITNADMPYQAIWQTYLAGKQQLTFGLDNEADITATDCQSHVTANHFMVALDDVFHYINLPLPGKHNIANALAATAACYALQLPPEQIVSGLAAMQGAPHRLQLRQGVNDSTLIDDSYNANPASYQQVLKTLTEFPGQHWLVLGDFAELGDAAATIHAELGQQAKSAGVNRLFTIGEQSALASDAFGNIAEHYQDLAALTATLETELTDQVTCLIKGSRFMQLDKLADQLASGGKQ